ncbi:unannotated protein [freshwater metagenome]|uniref:Unannotated protein n=1 Tax=freshwater metagenome TaxID=449393 RepID=A0A6J6BBA7_9ZZZZ
MGEGFIRLELFHDIEDARRISVRGIDHEDVNAGVSQCARPIPRVTEEPDCRTDAKSTFVVLRRVWVQLALLEIFDRDESDEFACVINKRKFFDLVLGE